MKKQKNPKTTEELLEEIKKLLILQIYKNGIPTKQEIGDILGVSYKTIERMFVNKSKNKKINKK